VFHTTYAVLYLPFTLSKRFVPLCDSYTLHPGGTLRLLSTVSVDRVFVRQFGTVQVPPSSAMAAPRQSAWSTPTRTFAVPRLAELCVFQNGWNRILFTLHPGGYVDIETVETVAFISVTLLPNCATASATQFSLVTATYSFARGAGRGGGWAWGDPTHPSNWGRESVAQVPEAEEGALVRTVAGSRMSRPPRYRVTAIGGGAGALAMIAPMSGR